MPDSSFTWRRLSFALPLDLVQAVGLLRQLATMSGSPRLVLEADGHAGQVVWRVGAERHGLDQVAELLHVEAPGSTLNPDADERTDAARAARVVIANHRSRAVASDRSEAAALALLGALAAARGREVVRLQVVLGVRLRPLSAPHNQRPSALATERRRLLASKTSEHGFGCIIRVAVTTGVETRDRQLVGGVLAAMRIVETPNQRVRLARSSARALNRAASPWCWPLRLSISELAALLGWPIGDLPLPGVAAAHPKTILASRAVAGSGRELGSNAVAGVSRPMALSVLDSLSHLHVLGPTGTGKSTLIGTLALQDMAAGRSVVVVDPKGDLVTDLLARIPSQRRDNVVILDATDAAPVGINPLIGKQADLAADGLVSVFRDLYADSWGPRTQDILHASLLSLARRGDASLVLVPLLLTNPGFRRSVVGRVAAADPMGIGSFWSWFESISDAERATVIAPLMNKLRPVLLRPGLRAMLGQTAPRFDLSEVFTERRIVLVNLAKGELGSDSARLLGSLVVSLLWQRALERSQLPIERRRPVMVFIDEVQDYLRLPGDLGDALAQARGLGVGFTLAHQHLAQLPTHLRSAVLANARSKVCFQLAHEDAVVMARGSELVPEDFTSLPQFQAYASLLTGGTPTPFASLSTQPLSDPTTNPADMRRRSRERYGRPLSEVEAAWATLAGQIGPDESLGRIRRGDAS